MAIEKLSQHFTNLHSPAEISISQPKKAEGGDFGDFLKDGIQKVNQELLTADKVSEEHLTTGKHDMHEVLMAIEKADISFRYLNQIRNKVLDAYQEIMRTQV